jgi:hypothetical protein
MTTKTDYKVTAALFLAFFALIIVGNLWLASAFDFPDILRQPAAERFARFQANQGAIIPAYYLMGLTSILQIFMAVAMYHLTKRGRLVDLFALTAGVLSGVFQVLGFLRWVILIPMLASAYGSHEISAEVIFFLEKFANTYLGMTVGEHLGTLFTGLWLLALGIVLVKDTAFDKKLAWLGLAAGIALIVQSYEAVNSAALSFLADISIALWALYVIWALILAIQLFRKQDDATPQPVHWAVWLLGLVVYLANVVPALL